MKYLAFLILVISSHACNDNGKTDANGIDQSAETIKFITDNSNIVGHWSLCAEFVGGQVTQYNVCPTVIFNSNGTGSKINPNGFPEPFSWTLNGKSLKISYSMINGNKTFPDTNYIAIIKQDTIGIELEIHQPKRDYTLYLRRGR